MSLNIIMSMREYHVNASVPKIERYNTYQERIIQCKAEQKAIDLENIQCIKSHIYSFKSIF